MLDCDDRSEYDDPYYDDNADFVDYYKVRPAYIIENKPGLTLKAVPRNIWIDKSGKLVNIHKMEYTYLKNLKAFMERTKLKTSKQYKVVCRALEKKTKPNVFAKGNHKWPDSGDGTGTKKTTQSHGTGGGKANGLHVTVPYQTDH